MLLKQQPKLLEYLKKTKYCRYCNNPCFESYITVYVQVNPNCVAATTMFDDTEEQGVLPFECHYCSSNCYTIWKFCNLWLW